MKEGLPAELFHYKEVVLDCLCWLRHRFRLDGVSREQVEFLYGDLAIVLASQFYLAVQELGKGNEISKTSINLDTVDFPESLFSKFQSVDYCVKYRWVVQSLVCKKGDSVSDLISFKVPFGEKKDSKLKKKVKTVVKAGISYLSQLRSSRCVYFYHIYQAYSPWKTICSLVRLWRIGIQRGQHFGSIIESPAATRRQTALEEHVVDGIEAALWKSVIVFGPNVCFVDYAPFEKVHPNIPKFLYSVHLWGLPFEHKLEIWKLKLLGAKLIVHQHGGGYGLERDHLPQKYEQKFSDMFWSWGWRVGNATPCPPMRALSIEPNRVKEQALIALGALAPSPARLQNSPYLPSAQKEMYRVVEEMVCRLERVNIAVRLKRPNVMFQTDSSRSFFNKHRNWVVDVGDKAGSRVYGRYKLVIFDYLGTGWLETIGANIPTVVVVNRKDYLFDKNAEWFVEKLFQAKIIHHSVESAVSHITAVWSDIPRWWDSEDVGLALQLFVENFAVTEKMLPGVCGRLEEMCKTYGRRS